MEHSTRVVQTPFCYRLRVRIPPLGMSRDEVRSELSRLRHPVRVVIDRAKNPFNIGAIIRTAHSFLVREIVLVGTERWYERAAMGMQRYENITEIPNVEMFLERAADENWHMVSFEKDHASVGLWEAGLPEDSVLVFGNEDDGVDPRIVAASHEVVGIPMYGSITATRCRWLRGWVSPSGLDVAIRTGVR